MPRTDEASLRALYREHAGPLLGLALRLTAGDRGRAEDIVQETLLRAWRNPDAVDPARGPVRPWLFTVARRVAVDAHRRRMARPAEVDAGLAEQATPGDEADRLVTSLLIGDALATLSPDHRAVLDETLISGRQVADAASRLGVPAGTVKSRTYYALRALRLALEERGVRP